MQRLRHAGPGPRAVSFGARLALALAPALFALALTWPRTPLAQAPRQPEAGTGFVERGPVRAKRFLAVTANEHATKAAHEMLEAGGSAVDAAIAAQMVLTLVEPQSSGIGGGAFLLHYDARSRRVRAYDGRETAPRDAGPDLFLADQGRPMRFFDAAVGGRAVGVPGVLRMLELAHARHGNLPWARLFEPAIALARRGFEVSPRLHALVDADPWLRKQPAAAAYFYDASRRAWPVGHRLRNAALADTLARIAERGSLALHAGEIARDIVEAVRRHPTNPGRLGEHDLAFYRPIEREPLCTAHGARLVCGMPPPSSGAIAVAQMLAYWRLGGAPTRLADLEGHLLAEGVHRFAEAGRLAFADRQRYVADTDFVALPGQRIGEATRTGPGTLLDPAYLASRSVLIGARSMGLAQPGTPSPARRSPLRAPAMEPASTSHVSIVDAAGHAVSMTTSIENSFGSRLLVRGFLLNNQLTDFSFEPVHDGRPVANRVEPGKRPRSSMAPTIVLDRASRELELVLGSPGGPSIIAYVARTLILVLDDGIPVQQAVSLPNFGNRNGATELESRRVDASIARALARRGHEVQVHDMTSGLHAIERECDGRRCRLAAGVDPRREGYASGR